MEIKNIDDCYKFRLLRNIPKSIEKSRKSIEQAEERLKEAKKALDIHFYKYVIIESYMAMFHASRAILYRDGVQEKSHYGISIYLKEKYGNKIPLNVINLLNIHRTERHETMYGLEYKPNKEEAKEALEDAKLFIKSIKDVLVK